MMGTDIESPSPTGHEHQVILAEDLAIQVENDVAASIEKIYGDDESIKLIPRVPKSLRQGANVAYDPQVVSIGPYHWGEPQLEGMEKHKRRYLVQFLNRIPGRCLQDYIKEIESLEPRLRSYYEKDVHKINRKNFVEMMLVDGCFVIEIILQAAVDNFGGDDDLGQIWSLDLMRHDLLLLENQVPFMLKFGKDDDLGQIWSLDLMIHDMLLLENQVPFILLQRIYDMATTTTIENLACPSSFIQVALLFCGLVAFRGHKDSSTPITFQHQLPKTIHHVMHLRHSLHTSCYSKEQPMFETPSSESSSPTMRRTCMCLFQMVTFGVFAASKKASDRLLIPPSATELHDSGINFKISKSPNPFHIKFQRGVMEVKPLYLSNTTASIFHNIVAFERLYFENTTSLLFEYLKFMDLLVNTSNDVALLRRYGIIDHEFGSDEEVALFFTQLTKGILIKQTSDSCKILYEKVNAYCSIKGHRWRASLIRDYCSSPWSTLGLGVGFILLALTFVQSYMSLHSYFLPPHS